MLDKELFATDLTTLVQARSLSHAACQWPSIAARANLPVADDDSHSNLGWSDRHFALLSRPLNSAGRIQLGFSFLSRSLIWLVDDRIEQRFDLTLEAGETVDVWLNRQLREANLNGIDTVVMPYSLPEMEFKEFAVLEEQTLALGRWFAAAETSLAALVSSYSSIGVNVPVPRCWPHHFDLAVLFALEAGDPETARSIGVGLSPGDASYAQPYFYVSPWPAPAPDELKAAPSPWRWHTDGFVALVCRSSDLGEQTVLTEVLANAFNSAQALLDS